MEDIEKLAELIADKLTLSLDRQSYNPSEAAVILGVSPPTVYNLLHSGKLRSIKNGTRRLIPRKCIEEWIDRELREQADGAGVG